MRNPTSPDGLKSGSGVAPPPAFGLFGCYRYLLATIVMASHFAAGRWEAAGQYSVFGFFILSGYVVCYILYYTYLPMEKGVLRFAANRMLRIYPLFWLANLCVLLLLFLFYSDPSLLAHSLVDYPRGIAWHRFAYWMLLNLSSLSSFLHMGYLLYPTLLPAGWSLGVEIFYWALMPFILLYKPLRIAFLAVAACYTLYVFSLSFQPPANLMVLRYFSPLAGAFPFAIGLMCFLYKRHGYKPIPHWAGLGALAGFLVLILMQGFSPPSFDSFYPCVAFNAIAVFYLSRFDPRSLPGSLRQWDAALGDLSYPIFLMHVPASLLLQAVLPPLPLLTFLCLGVLLTNLLALLLHYAVEFPIDRLRNRIKHVS